MLPFFFFLMIRRPPRSTLSSSSAASDVYKRQALLQAQQLAQQHAEARAQIESAAQSMEDRIKIQERDHMEQVATQQRNAVMARATESESLSRRLREQDQLLAHERAARDRAVMQAQAMSEQHRFYTLPPPATQTRLDALSSSTHRLGPGYVVSETPPLVYSMPPPYHDTRTPPYHDTRAPPQPPVVPPVSFDLLDSNGDGVIDRTEWSAFMQHGGGHNHPGRPEPSQAGTLLERVRQARIAAERSVMESGPVSYTHLRAHETPEHLVCRLLLEKKKKHIYCKDTKNTDSNKATQGRISPKYTIIFLA
eukprot:TRINITY_DN8570_c0_g2_i3.p1 TRINITY_DN8570_c0_g2~~TRINITY_DN8570_c0_g2_i3.p1  ORF type:complete len:308 (+),score=81.08 TRINITY_DN8570_c0_g2_i3:55-978(+)